MATLLEIIASTRPGRIGLPIGRWFEQYARDHGAFSIEVADLAEVNLPLFNEPKHPRMGDYVHDHTKSWSQVVDRADAVVIVLPEYNYSMTATLVNAITYLSREWNYKPVGLVSYGGASGGLRAAQQVKQLVTTVRMMPIPEGVSFHFAQQYLKDGVFTPPTEIAQTAGGMLDELVRWAQALRPLRDQ